MVDAPSWGFIGNPRASAGEREDASAPLPGSGTTGRTLDAPARTTPRNTPARTHGAGAAAWARRASSGRPPCVVIVGGASRALRGGTDPGEARAGGTASAARGRAAGRGGARPRRRAPSPPERPRPRARPSERGARPGKCSQRGKILAGSTRRARRGGRTADELKRSVTSDACESGADEKRTRSSRSFRTPYPPPSPEPPPDPRPRARARRPRLLPRPRHGDHLHLPPRLHAERAHGLLLLRLEVEGAIVPSHGLRPRRRARVGHVRLGVAHVVPSLRRAAGGGREARRGRRARRGERRRRTRRDALPFATEEAAGEGGCAEGGSFASPGDPPGGER